MTVHSTLSTASVGRGESGTFDVAQAVQLAVVERGGFVESRHSGCAVVLAPDGATIASHGVPTAPILPRSAMKPFQAVAVMAAGVPLEGAAAAIAAASHSGTPAHVSLVRSLLARANLHEDALACPPAYPLDEDSRVALLRAGEPPRPIYMTCSGKHAAMLLACVQNGWPIEGYLDPQHPLQLHVRDVVERLTGQKVTTTVADGCGAPVHAMPLLALARGIQRVATAAESSPFAMFRYAAVLRRSVLQNAWAIDGIGRANTVIIERLGVFAKWGAEGVLVAATPDGTTVALKMLDGGLRAATIVALAMLVDAGALSAAGVAAVMPELDLDVHGGLAAAGGLAVVGSVRPRYARTSRARTREA